MDRAVLGAAGAPAALRLHAAVIGLHAGLLGPGPDAVRYLVEAILQRLRTDLDRLKEDVVLRIARHRPSPPSSIRTNSSSVRVLPRFAGDVHTRGAIAGPVRLLLARLTRRDRSRPGSRPRAGPGAPPATTATERCGGCPGRARPGPAGARGSARSARSTGAGS